MNGSRKHDRWKRRIVLGCAVGAALSYFVAFSFPMWGFYLSAPQYPDGLVLAVYLDKIGGDVSEINTLNHYIGMAKLDEAAQFERAMAGYGLSGLGLIVLLLVFLPGRRYARYFAFPAMIFPLVFLAVTFAWMYTFGHTLSPDAPVSMPSFTPTLLGTGKIGNFHTEGLPGAGFYLILLSSVLVAVAFWLRRDVCGKCPRAHSCGAICPKLFFGKDGSSH
jgi:hypothetical protein